MSGRGIRRFYKESGVAAEGSGFVVVLDGRPIRTPLRALLSLPNAPLAEAIAAEWRAQGDFIRPFTMPLTQLANTALDRMGDAARAPMIDQMLRFAATDLLCYRADHPVELAERQETLWRPILDWLAIRYDASLAVTAGIMAIPQALSTLRALRAALESLDAFTLAVVQSVAAASGSLALGLALADGRVSADEAFSLAHVDETFQSEYWGEDEEAVRRRDSIHADMRAAATFLTLAGQ